MLWRTTQPPPAHGHEKEMCADFGWPQTDALTDQECKNERANECRALKSDRRAIQFSSRASSIASQRDIAIQHERNGQSCSTTGHIAFDD
eukprot:695882-Pleurochrysis_carterae.AAC.3